MDHDNSSHSQRSPQGKTCLRAICGTWPPDSNWKGRRSQDLGVLALPPESASQGLLFLVYEEIVATDNTSEKHYYEIDLGACFAESQPQEKVPIERVHRKERRTKGSGQAK